jgi:hypothetical protein
MLNIIKSLINKLLILIGLKEAEVITKIEDTVAPVEAKVESVVAEVKKEV